jgi:hypothetical protein
VKVDRPHSRQSSRDEDRYRPQSTHSSRDEDRLSSKDVAPSRRYGKFFLLKKNKQKTVGRKFFLLKKKTPQTNGKKTIKLLTSKVTHD